MLGGLLRYLTTAHAASFQPINANFGLLPALSTVVADRQERNRCHVERATMDFGSWRDDARIPTVAGPP
jgi:methylenetetrahydrofolate--tRNA-(uracil-5-)-methyltransferase